MASLPLFLAALQAASDSDGLTFGDVLANVPRDPASIFVMLLLLAGLVSIVWVGRSRGPRPPRSDV